MTGVQTCALPIYRHPEGWQAVLRKNGSGALLVLHTFKNSCSEIRIPLGGNYKITETYPKVNAEISNGNITIQPDGDFCGMGIILE